MVRRLVPGVLAVLTLALGAPWTPARAEEVLEFKPLPPESVSRLEAERGRRRIPAPPTPPASPSAIPPRSKTDVVIGKSGNVMRIGADVHVDRDQVISGDLLAVGGDVTVDGHVEGDVVAMGGDVRLNSTARVDGDVACIGGELSEEPGASVGGQRVTAMGARGFRGLRGMREDRIPGAVHGFTKHVVSSTVWLLIMLAIAWGFARLAPGRTEAARRTLQREAAISLGIGALVWALLIPSVIALSLVVAILCITIIGIPLALAALFAYGMFLGLLWVWGYVVAMAAVGRWVMQRRGAASPAPAAEPQAPAGTTLAREAVLGVLVVSGIGLAGQLLQTLFFAPPLQGLGTFISVVSIVAGGLATTFGAGALLRTEIASGTLGRWWRGRRPTPVAATPGAAPAVPEAAIAAPPLTPPQT